MIERPTWHLQSFQKPHESTILIRILWNTYSFIFFCSLLEAILTLRLETENLVEFEYEFESVLGRAMPFLARCYSLDAFQ